jgi:hypothetical protein
VLEREDCSKVRNRNERDPLRKFATDESFCPKSVCPCVASVNDFSFIACFEEDMEMIFFFFCFEGDLEISFFSFLLDSEDGDFIIVDSTSRILLKSSKSCDSLRNIFKPVVAFSGFCGE